MGSCVSKKSATKNNKVNAVKAQKNDKVNVAKAQKKYVYSSTAKGNRSWNRGDLNTGSIVYVGMAASTGCDCGVGGCGSGGCDCGGGGCGG